MTQAEQLKQEILEKTKEYYELVHKTQQTKQKSKQKQKENKQKHKYRKRTKRKTTNSKILKYT
jgi:hypothetical protein